MMKDDDKIYGLWKPISFTDNWQNCDTSILDDISKSWFQRRSVLKANSQEYKEFLSQLKREHAIETGVIERLYDLSKGITETFIKEGFVKSYLSHGDTDIPKEELMDHLKDHLDAVNFVFDVVKENRPLTTGFIKELHHLVTRHQKHAEGRDQFGNKLKIGLLKGIYKERENNPTREDGVIIKYCPPIHVESEMDNLVCIYNELVENGSRPLIIAVWFHHAFTTIHPFQDGNGRVARLLASLIFIKFGYFPFTVLREEAKVKYIEALEEADLNKPQKLVSYFGEVQKRNIQKALNIREVTTTSLSEVREILSQKLEQSNSNINQFVSDQLEENRKEVTSYCSEVLIEFKRETENQLNGNAQINVEKLRLENTDEESYYYRKIMDYAKKHDYYINLTRQIDWLAYIVQLKSGQQYRLVISIHNYGYGNTSLSLGAFLEYDLGNDIDSLDKILLLDIPPHVISLGDDIEPKKKNIKKYIEYTMTLVLTEIVNEIS